MFLRINHEISVLFNLIPWLLVFIIIDITVFTALTYVVGVNPLTPIENLCGGFFYLICVVRFL